MLKHCLPVPCLLLAGLAIGVSSVAANDAVEKEIRGAADSFAESFNKHDAAALAAQWTEDGVYVNEDGERYEGRKAIESEYKTLFAGDQKLRMVIEVDSVRVVNPDTAIEEGRVAILPQPPGATRVMSQYTAVHVRKDGKWRMVNVRDTRVELSPDNGQLEDLDWLVGTWGGTTKGGSALEVKFRWITNRQFLERTYSVIKAGKETAAGLQVIGVDPSTGLITSWTFTSDGHAVGLWAPHENGWITESNGVMSDGTPTAATHTLSRQDENTVVWKSADRSIGEELLPDSPEVALKRK